MHFIILACFLVIGAQLSLILWLKPGYGLTDDGSLLLLCDKAANSGLFATFFQFVRDDLHWGMFRPFYYWFAQAFYCPTANSPEWLYFWNALFLFINIGVCGWIYFQILTKKSWPRAIAIAVFFLICLCVYRFHDLFSIVSLQEKIVFFIGVTSWGIFHHLPKLQNKFLPWLLIPLCLLFGFATKAQFLLFLPGLFLLLLAGFWGKEKKAHTLFRLFYFFFFAILGMYIIQRLAAAGVYTNRYSIINLKDNLLSRQALLLLATALLSMGGEIYFLRKNLHISSLARALLPASAILAFIVIMSPWKIDDSYLLSITAPSIAFCLLSLLQNISLQKFKYVFFPLITLALTLTLYRGYRAFARYSDLQTILFSEKVAAASQKPHLLVISCAEGSEHIKTYLRRHSGYNLQTAYLYSEPLSAKREVYIIADTAFCPLDPALRSRVEIQSEPKFSGSFALYKLVK